MKSETCYLCCLTHVMGHFNLTHWGSEANLKFRAPSPHWFRKWLLCLNPQHHLNQCLPNDNWLLERYGCGCLVTWFCYQAKPGNKTDTTTWLDIYIQLKFYSNLYFFFIGSLVQDWGMFQPNLNEANKLNKQKSNQKVCVALQEKYHRMQRAHRVSAGRRKN